MQNYTLYEYCTNKTLVNLKLSHKRIIRHQMGNNLHGVQPYLQVERMITHLYICISVLIKQFTYKTGLIGNQP